MHSRYNGYKYTHATRAGGGVVERAHATRIWTVLDGHESS